MPRADIDLPGGPGQNTGHGHVFARPDGSRARCGGPRLCQQCRDDQARLDESRRHWTPEGVGMLLRHLDEIDHASDSLACGKSLATSQIRDLLRGAGSANPG